jgi:GDP-L-fucose synthase
VKYIPSIFVAGGNTLLGHALIERLDAAGDRHVVGRPPDEPDLSCAGQVEDFFGEFRPQQVIVAAGRSGGIQANWARPAELMLDNLLAGAHVIHTAYRHGTSRLLYLASSCAYPRQAPQPLHPESLLTGPPESTSAAYALAKLACWKLCQAYRQQYGVRFLTAFPAGAFGPGDDFSPENGHVVPALLRRMHQAKVRGEESVTIWGSGRARREFIFVRDLADACLFVLERYDNPEPINLGSGWECTIAQTARLIAEVVGYRGRLRFDATRPDGAARKILDSGPLFALGWRPATEFRAALEQTYAWFCIHEATEGTGHVRAAV